MEFEGDLFSGLEEPEAVQPEATPYDKIIETRKNASFAAEQIESQDEVQVVERNDAPVTEPVAEEKPKIEYHTYPLDEVKAAAKEYFHGDALAGDVWTNKYALKDSDGNIYELTPDDMHHRIAREIARIERRYPNPMKEEEIYEVLKDFRYIVPQGSPMTGIGNDFQISSLSNCFVIGNNGDSDSYGGIMKTDQEQVQLMKRRGGVGHDLSHLRPTGSPVKNCALTSTGVVPFMERYSNSTKEVAQDGRRGALMMTISIKHPDSEAFIDAKMTQGRITNANVSVRITDISHRLAQPEIHQGSGRPRLVEQDHPQRMEVGRTWRDVLGHHHP